MHSQSECKVTNPKAKVTPERHLELSTMYARTLQILGAYDTHKKRGVRENPGYIAIVDLKIDRYARAHNTRQESIK
jgi:hypothetical protein